MRRIEGGSGMERGLPALAAAAAVNSWQDGGRLIPLRSQDCLHCSTCRPSKPAPGSWQGDAWTGAVPEVVQPRGECTRKTLRRASGWSGLPAAAMHAARRPIMQTREATDLERWRLQRAGASSGAMQPLRLACRSGVPCCITLGGALASTTRARQKPGKPQTAVHRSPQHRTNACSAHSQCDKVAAATQS